MASASKVFDKYWFNKHQNRLLKLANSIVGNYVFGFNKQGINTKSKIIILTPNSIGFLCKYTNKKITINETFFTQSVFAKRLRFILAPIWWFMHISDFFTSDYFNLAPTLNFGFNSLTANPDASNVDGGLWYQHIGGGETWATAISAANTDGGGYATQGSPAFGTTECGARSSWFSNNGFECERTVFQFDTSSLTSGATISAADISLYGVSFIDGDADATNGIITIVTSSPSSLTALVSADYGQVQRTAEQIASGSRIRFNVWNTSGYNQLSFNSTGIGNINKTGVSKFAAITGFDLLGTGQSQVNGQENRVVFYSSGNATNKPQLNIIYQTSVTTPLTLAVTGTATATGAYSKTIQQIISAIASAVQSVIYSKIIQNIISTIGIATGSLISNKIIQNIISIVASASAGLTNTKSLNRTISTISNAIESIIYIKNFHRIISTIGTATSTLSNVVIRVTQKIINALATATSNISLNRIKNKIISAIANATETITYTKTLNYLISVISNASINTTKGLARIIGVISTASANIIKINVKIVYISTIGKAFEILTYNKTFRNIIGTIGSTTATLTRKLTLSKLISISATAIPEMIREISKLITVLSSATSTLVRSPHMIFKMVSRGVVALARKNILKRTINVLSGAIGTMGQRFILSKVIATTAIAISGLTPALIKIIAALGHASVTLSRTPGITIRIIAKAVIDLWQNFWFTKYDKQNTVYDKKNPQTNTTYTDKYPPP